MRGLGRSRGLGGGCGRESDGVRSSAGLLSTSTSSGCVPPNGGSCEDSAITAECCGSFSEVVDPAGVVKGFAVSGSGSGSVKAGGAEGPSISSSGTE